MGQWLSLSVSLGVRNSDANEGHSHDFTLKRGPFISQTPFSRSHEIGDSTPDGFRKLRSVGSLQTLVNSPRKCPFTRATGQQHVKLAGFQQKMRDGMTPLSEPSPRVFFKGIPWKGHSQHPDRPFPTTAPARFVA